MLRLLRLAVAVSLVLWSGTAALALPVAGTETPSPQPPTTNTTAQQQLSIAYASRSTSSQRSGSSDSGFRTSESLIIDVTEGSVTLGPQTETRLRVQDTTTGQTLTLTPANDSASVTVNGPLEIEPPTDPDGPPASIEKGELSVTASGDTDIFKQPKFGPFVVSVLGSDGTVLAQTDPAPHGVFRPDLTGEFNDTAVALERPSDFNASWDVRLYPTFDALVDDSPVRLTNAEGAQFMRAETTLPDETPIIRVYPSEDSPDGARISDIGFDLTRVEGPVGARGAPGGGSGSPGAVKPNVTAVSQPSSSVSANSSFEIDYRITNPDEAPTAFTFTVPTTSPNLSVAGFAGEIQGPNPDGTPPSTSTTAVDPGQTASVTVTYRVAANATGTGNVTVEASSAFLNGTGAATTTVELGEPAVPSTPRGRALQVAGVEDPAAISQRDITVAITLRDRGQPTNGVNVSQRDITTLITLRDRARESQPSRRGY